MSEKCFAAFAEGVYSSPVSGDPAVVPSEQIEFQPYLMQSSPVYKTGSDLQSSNSSPPQPGTSHQSSYIESSPVYRNQIFGTTFGLHNEITTRPSVMPQLTHLAIATGNDVEQLRAVPSLLPHQQSLIHTGKQQKDQGPQL